MRKEFRGGHQIGERKRDGNAQHRTGRTIAPAHTTGMFTDPGVALTVPWALMAFAQTGKFIAVMSVTSRTPASITSPTTPRARAETASSSPNIPSVDSAVVVTTRTSPD